MKNYKKPVINSNAFMGICEPVYMGSGFYTYERYSCYQTSFTETQSTTTGFPYMVYQMDGTHAANHTTENQDFYFEFNEVLPDFITGISISGAVIRDDNEGGTTASAGNVTISGDRTFAKCTMAYHQNGNDKIGLASFEMHFNINPEADSDAVYRFFHPTVGETSIPATILGVLYIDDRNYYS